MGCIPNSNKENSLIRSNYKSFDDKIISYYSFSDFSVISYGDFGPIYRVKSKLDNKTYTMKIYKKKNVLLSKSLYSVLNELVFYKKNNLNNRLIVNLRYAFEDSHSFYVIQSYISGGSLKFHMEQIQFTEKRAKFIIACLILSLEYLHTNGYIYRNLTPDNILLNESGYPLIADFKPIREFTRINYSDISGTLGYIAPEIILRKQYIFNSDFFSLGVIAYEMMFNKLPYQCKTRQEYIENLINQETFIRKNDELPDEWSLTSADFINRCLIRNCETRLGYNGIRELKEHLWFEDVNWDNLAKMNENAPFVPDKNRSNFKKPKKRDGKRYTRVIKDYIEGLEVNEMFNGYYYDYNKTSHDYEIPHDNLEILYKYIDKEIQRLDDGSVKEVNEIFKN